MKTFRSIYFTVGSALSILFLLYFSADSHAQSPAVSVGIIGFANPAVCPPVLNLNAGNTFQVERWVDPTLVNIHCIPNPMACQANHILKFYLREVGNPANRFYIAEVYSQYVHAEGVARWTTSSPIADIVIPCFVATGNYWLDVEDTERYNVASSGYDCQLAAPNGTPFNCTGPPSGTFGNLDCYLNAIAQLNVTSAPPLTLATTVVNNATCANSNGDATVGALGGTSPYSYQWVSPATAGPTISSVPAGSYDVTVTDANTCTANTTVVIGRTPPLPGTVDFTISPTNACPAMGVQINFTDNNPFDPGLTYSWDFGDGNTAVGQNQSHSYAYPDKFNVVLTTTNSCGESASASQLVEVVRDDCSCSASWYDIFDGHTISGSATWNAVSYRIEGEVVIPAGASLTVGLWSTLKFGPMGKIIVLPGGTLNGEFFSMTSLAPWCDQMWKGIEVRGVATDPSTSATQGVVALTDGIIENAHIGVLAGKQQDCVFDGSCSSPFDLSASRGKVVLQRMDFNNNGIGVQIIRNVNTDNFEGDITECNFNGGALLEPRYDLANAYAYNNHPFYANANFSGRSAAGIYQYNAKNLAARANSFTDTEVGMESYDSKFDVVAYNGAGSQFDNCTYGISIFNTNHFFDKRHLVEECRFTNIKDPAGNASNSAGIRIDGGLYDRVRKNAFSSAVYSQADFPTGIYMHHATSSRTTNNEFYKLQNGVICNNSFYGGAFIGNETNNFDKNKFSDCERGIVTDFLNTALKVQCNDHDNSAVTAPYLNSWYNGTMGKLANQGYTGTVLTDYAAGNEFRPQAEKIIDNDWYLTYDYIHHLDGNSFLTPSPGGIVSPSLFGLAPSTQSGCTWGPPGPYDRKEYLDDLKAAIAILKTELDDLDLTIDGGDTQALLDAIANSTSSATLRNLLVANSFLSDPVLIAYCNEVEEQEEQHFAEVLANNSPVSQDVEPFLLAAYNYLPADVVATLQGVQVVHLRTSGAIKREILQVKSIRQVEENSHITDLLDLGDEEEVVAYLEEENTMHSDQQLAEMFLVLGDYSSAAEKLEEITETDAATLNWKELFALRSEVFSSGRDYHEITAEEITTIEGYVVNNPPDLAAIQAQNILQIALKRLYPMHIPYGEDEKSKQTRIQIQNNFELFPNPATNEVYVQFEQAPISGFLELFDLQGRGVRPTMKLSEEPLVRLNTSTMNPGIYIVTLKVRGVNTSAKRLVVLD